MKLWYLKGFAQYKQSRASTRDTRSSSECSFTLGTEPNQTDFLLLHKLHKPAIHYSRTWQIGNETILFVKTGQMCYCTLFVVRCQFSHEHIRHWEFLFFNKKFLCVRRSDRYLDANPANSIRWKTCLQNIANTYYILFAVCRFFIHPCFIIVCE